MKTQVQQELARLEGMLAQAIRERDEQAALVLRIEGAVVTLRALLKSEEEMGPGDDGKPVVEIDSAMMAHLADQHATATLYDAGIEATQEQ